MGIMAIPDLGENWPTARPENVGLAPVLGANLDGAFSRGECRGLHAMLIVRHGKLAVEHYFPGADECWGQPLDDTRHGPDLLHDLRSVSKSIVGLLYGIALGEGVVPAPATRLAEAFPDHADLLAAPPKHRITIGHVLSMRLGLAWDEGLDYSDPANPERQMEAAPDRIRFVLGLPAAGKPGGQWVYCGGATALLGNLIERGTGQRLEDYARDRLFAPLGISQYQWVNGSDGRAAAASGLRLTGRDLARIGQMMLDRGTWKGRRVVPASWILASIKPRAFVESGMRYGYQWWLGQLAASGKPWHAAFGNGGQRLFVVPSLGMVIVILAGNYNTADQWKMPVQLMARIVMPALRD